MQFTVIVEFLIPGLATLLLSLAFFPGRQVPPLPGGLAGETATALVLLAVSYPVGHLVNFPVYMLLQRRLLTPKARQSIVKEYAERRIDLPKLAGRPSGFLGTPEEVRDLFAHIRAVVLGMNIERFNSYHQYHEGIQRLSRGMLVPIIMAIVLVWREKGPLWVSLALALGSSFLVLLALLMHSVRREEDQFARFFVTSSRPQAIEEARQCGQSGPQSIVTDKA